MLRPVLLAVAIAASLPASLIATNAHAAAPTAVAPTRNAATQALYALFDEEWERGMRENPEEASYRGDKRYNDRWTDMSMSGDPGAHGRRPQGARTPARDRPQGAVGRATSSLRRVRLGPGEGSRAAEVP